jgi:hypothetical protein
LIPIVHKRYDSLGLEGDKGELPFRREATAETLEGWQSERKVWTGADGTCPEDLVAGNNLIKGKTVSGAWLKPSADINARPCG